MNDLISRKALIKAIETIEARYGNDNSSLIEQGEVLDLIAEAPTIDVEPVKHGHWIEQEAGNLDTYYTCSACKEDFCLIEGEPSDNLWNYCPDCGAKMDEVSE